MPWIERGGRVPSFEWAETVLAGATSPALIIRPISSRGTITVTAKPGAGTAEVEFTTSPEADVIALTADWQSWDAGAVGSITTDRLLSPITALRFKAVTANADFEVII